MSSFEFLDRRRNLLGNISVVQPRAHTIISSGKNNQTFYCREENHKLTATKLDGCAKVSHELGLGAACVDKGEVVETVTHAIRR